MRKLLDFLFKNLYKTSNKFHCPECPRLSRAELTITNVVATPCHHSRGNVTGMGQTGVWLLRFAALLL